MKNPLNVQEKYLSVIYSGTVKTLALIFLASTAFAALPPLAQSARELQALLADSRFYESLGGAERVREVIRVEKGYLVLTQNYAMRVDIEYEKGQKRIGPVQFQLEFHQPVNLRTGEVKFYTTRG